MGNYLVKANDDLKINDTILGKNVKKVLKNIQQMKKISEAEFKFIPINKQRACCLGIAKPKSELKENDFLTVKLPRFSGENIKDQNLGLEFADENNYCSNNKLNQIANCEYVMVNQCAKSLYDMDCIKSIKKNNKNIAVWNSGNKKCFKSDGSLEYGPEECACVNSFSGFSLNTKPSSSIVDDAYAEEENPYNIAGSKFNSFTKYSANLFNYDAKLQRPINFDTRCADSNQAKGSKRSGLSKPYLLEDYKVADSICLNQINIGDSEIGEANFSNIKMVNACGGGTNFDFKKNEKPKEVATVVKDGDEEEDNKVDDEKEIVKEEENGKNADSVTSQEIDDTKDEDGNNANGEATQEIAELKELISQLLETKIKDQTTEDTSVIPNEEIDNTKDENKSEEIAPQNNLLIVLLLIITLIIIFFIVRKILKK